MSNMELHSEFLSIADRLDKQVGETEASPVRQDALRLKDAADKIGRSFSDSWHGDHAYVYYANFETPPPGAHFSSEWGLIYMSYSSLGSKENWHQFDPEEIKNLIRQIAGVAHKKFADEYLKLNLHVFEAAKSELKSLSATATEAAGDKYLAELKSKIEGGKFLTKHDFIERVRPRGEFMTRDTVVIGQGIKVPPHVNVAGEDFSVIQTPATLQSLSKYSRDAGSHLTRKSKCHKYQMLLGPIYSLDMEDRCCGENSWIFLKIG